MAVQTRPWPSADVLAENERRLVRDLEKRLRHFETRYELPSTKLVAEVTAGRLRETKEVCDWLIDWELYQRLTNES